MKMSSTKIANVGRPSADYQNKENVKILYERFRELWDKKHKELGWTFTSFEKDFGVSHSTTNALYNGNRPNISIDNLISISKAFNVPIDYLVGIQNETSRDLSIQNIEKKTGLSEKSIKNLFFLNENDETEELDYIFKNQDMLIDLLGRLNEFLYVIPNDSLDEIEYMDYEEIKLKKLNNSLIHFKNTLPKSQEIYSCLINDYSKKIKDISSKEKKLAKEFKIENGVIYNPPITNDDNKSFTLWCELSEKLYKYSNNIRDLQNRINTKKITTNKVEKNKKKGE